MSRHDRSRRDPIGRQADAERALTELSNVLLTLSERERRIIMMRFGLLDYEPKTLDEIGRVFGVSRERIPRSRAKSCHASVIPVGPDSWRTTSTGTGSLRFPTTSALARSVNR